MNNNDYYTDSDEDLDYWIKSEYAPLTVNESILEAERLLHEERHQSLPSKPRLSGLDITLEDLKMLMLLDGQVVTPRNSLLSHKVDLERCEQVMKRMRLLTCIAAIGGFLSGYNTGVISGALLILKRVFDLSSLEQEMIVFSTIVSAFVSSVFGGSINQAFGRRRTILGAAAIFGIGSLIMCMAQSYAMLVLGEVLLGIGIGIESLTSPMYISEVAKPSIRGTLVSAYALMMCCGQFVAGVVDGIFGIFEGGWRFMFGLAALPAMVMFVGFLYLPESPTWLVSTQSEEEARDILRSVRDSETDVTEELDDLKSSIRSSSGGSDQDGGGELTALETFRMILRNPPTRRALTVGCGLMVLQQACGVNTVMYYAALIYRMSGFSEIMSIWLSAFTALAQIFGLALTVLFVETAGRRVLILSSLTLSAVALLGLGGAFYLARIGSPPVTYNLEPFPSNECAARSALVWDGVTRFCYDCVQLDGCGYIDGACVAGDEFGAIIGQVPFPETEGDWYYEACNNPYGWMAIFSMVSFLIFFGIGMAGLPWTVNSEIYPVQVRSLAVSISTGTNWVSNLIVSATFLTISSPSVLTAYGAFWLYSGLSFLGAVWLYFVLPETNGLSLTEIGRAFTRPHDHIIGEQVLLAPGSSKYGSL